ncbi:MAG: hypothetical protein N2482_00050 [Patescibacteria group bacterium]|nr:hypothetical protein [Patescibacteria group bacterium]
MIFLICANLIIFLIFILKINRLPPQIPLFYSKLWGEDRLADLWMIFFLPFFLNFFVFINNFVSKKFFKENPLIQKILSYLNLFLIIVVPLIFIKIITLIA